MTTRERILEAALASFVAAGYERTSVAEIAERSGVSNGSLFHHFPTKPAIAEALQVEAMRSVQAGQHELLRRRPRSLRAALRGTIANQLGWIEANPDLARFLYARGHPDAGSWAAAEIAALNRELGESYREWMAPLLAAGEIGEMPMVLLTAIVTGPAHSLAQRWLAGQLETPLRSFVEPLTDAAVGALSRPRRRAAAKPG